jgi:hypothetical protein
MNLTMASEIEAQAQQNAEIQAKLIAKFGLPVHAKNVELFCQPFKKPYERFFQGLLKWEMQKEVITFNSLTQVTELKMVVEKQSRRLGPSLFDLVAWALQGA